MGQNLQNISEALFGDITKKQYRVLMLGLDASGKTSILYRLKLGKLVTTLPTIGFNVQTIQPSKNSKVVVWDVGGNDKIRPLWRHYYLNTQGVIFVIDSADIARFDQAKATFKKIQEESELQNIPFLIFANKNDIAKKSLPEITQYFQLHRLKKRQWYIQNSTVTNSEGIHQGLEWLTNAMSKK